ncbi:MAG: S8 family serine peptidase [Candidatus Promineifilaceae bacterium]|nr:S8 family serine peptidase [Candidatus Promineifilaceae bacterium]
MNHFWLNTPWAGRTSLYSAPGSAVFKLALGEAPRSIPSAADIRAGAQQPATRTSVGAVDRILAHFAHHTEIARVHTAAATLGDLGQQHLGFNDLEEILGLSRTFRVQADHACAIDDLVDALRQVSVVEQAYPNYLSALPFSRVTAVPLIEPALSPIVNDIRREDDGWPSRRQVHAVKALAYENGDPSIIIGVVDTGVAQNHQELSSKIRRGIDTVQLQATQMAQGIQLVGDLGGIDTDPEDNVGHGTACAGIIAAQGQHIPPGLAGECRLLPVRVLGAARFPGKKELSGVGALGDIDQGVKMCADLGAKVINMSFGTPESALAAHDPKPHSDVVRYCLARGCILIAASGNSGLAERFAPASLENVIAVGAVDPFNRPAPFSTGGDHVDIAAPGVRVLSTGLEGYQLVTGTSFAAPFVAAAAGLLVSRAARRAYPLDSAGVRHLLISSATPWPEGRVEGHGPGILNVYAALQTLDREIDRSMTQD